MIKRLQSKEIQLINGGGFSDITFGICLLGDARKIYRRKFTWEPWEDLKFLIQIPKCLFISSIGVVLDAAYTGLMFRLFPKISEIVQESAEKEAKA